MGVYDSTIVRVKKFIISPSVEVISCHLLRKHSIVAKYCVPGEIFTCLEGTCYEFIIFNYRFGKFLFVRLSTMSLIDYKRFA